MLTTHVVAAAAAFSLRVTDTFNCINGGAASIIKMSGRDTD